MSNEQNESDAKTHPVETLVMPLTDGKWYWVRYEGLHTVYEAPAMYKELVNCFYSYQFAGIPKRQLTVLREA